MKPGKSCGVILKNTYHIGLKAGLDYQDCIQFALFDLYQQGFYDFHIEMACNPHEAVSYLQYRQAHDAKINIVLYAANLISANYGYVKDNLKHERLIIPSRSAQILQMLTVCDEIVICKRHLPYLLSLMLRHRKFRKIHIVKSNFTVLFDG